MSRAYNFNFPVLHSLVMNVTTLSTGSYATGKIWLDEDITPVFAAKYWTAEFYTGLIIIMIVGMIHVVCYTYYRPFKYDMSQKLIKLEAMNIDPVLQKDVRCILSPYIDHNLDLMDVIFEFSGITNTMDNIMQYLNSIMASNISHSPSSLYRRFRSNLLIWFCIIITYILLFHSSIHIIDSNRSFVEVPCVLAADTSCFNLRPMSSQKSTIWQSCIYEFDLSEYLDKMNTTESYIFYGKVYITGDENRGDDYTHSVYCSINEDTLKYRYLDEDDAADKCKQCNCCGWLCCRKCGRCCNYCYQRVHCSCCDDNCLLLCFTIITGCMMGIWGCLWLLMSESNIKDTYRIAIKEQINGSPLIVGHSDEKELI